MSDFISVNLKKLKDNKIPNPEIDLRILLNYSRCCENEIILSNFKTDQIDQGWDGISQASSSNNVFIYKIIVYSELTGSKYEYMGTVMVL